ncbi:MAG: hypothetical protein FWH55_07280 [Oscillospiraceae bacterium]|nr:hypothetical protein [Oscillospiraceae bacterium]
MYPLTLIDLLAIAALVVTIVAGFLLVKLLSSAGGVLSSLNRILKNNRKSIDSVLKDLPKITENVTEISSDAQVIVAALKEEQKVIEDVIRDVSDTVGAVSATAQAINEDVFSKVKALFKALAMLVNIILKRTGTADGSDSPGGDASDEGLSRKEARVLKRRSKKRRKQKKTKKVIDE